MDLIWLLSHISSLLMGYETCNQYKIQIQIKALATFLINFRAHMNIVFITK